MAKPGNSGLTWRQAWFELLNGRKIKLSSWEGYWIWENNTIIMHCSNGEILDIRKTENVAYTFTNIATNDWEVLPDDYELKPCNKENNISSEDIKSMSGD